MTQDLFSQPTDQDALNLTHAMALQESSNDGKVPDYNLVGDNGTSIGAYQWHGKDQQDAMNSFKSDANSAGLNPNDFSPENQDKVAYAKVISYKNGTYGGKPLDPGQIASTWNSGSPNNWQNHSGTTMINGKEIQYDTPAHVQGVKKYFDQISKQNPVDTTSPNQQTTSNSSGNIGLDTLKGVGDFLFPIAGDIYHDIKGDSNKKFLQQVGDAGLSTLPFIPGLGEVGEGLRGADAAIEGANALSKTGNVFQALHPALKGAITGYGAGIAQNLSSGQDIGQSLMPNMSTLGGAGLGAVSPYIISKVLGPITKNLTQQGAVNAVESNLTDELTRLRSNKNLMANMPNNGRDAISLIANAAHHSYLPEVNGTNFDSEEALKAVDNGIASLGKTRAAALDSMGTTHSLDAIGAKAKAELGSNPFSGQSSKMNNQIDSIIEDIKNALGTKDPITGEIIPRDSITTSELEQLKETQATNSGIYKQTGAIADQNAASSIGNIARDKIEQTAADSGLPHMQEYNQLMKNHYHARTLLQKLGVQTVAGGRLGNMLRGHTAGVVAGLAGNALGGGFMGTIGAALGGESASHFISKIMGDTSLSNPLRNAILDRVATENPELVNEMQRFGKTTGPVAQIMKPKSGLGLKSVGKLSKVLNAGAIRGGVKL
jgi:hypothetical protein